MFYYLQYLSIKENVLVAAYPNNDSYTLYYKGKK